MIKIRFIKQPLELSLDRTQDIKHSKNFTSQPLLGTWNFELLLSSLHHKQLPFPKDAGNLQ